jgi:hypothetical protein
MTQFVRKSMAIRPEDRFQSVKAMRTALDNRLQKLKQQSRAMDSNRVQQSVKRQPSQPTAQQRERQQQVVKVRRYLDEYAPKLAPVVTPMLKPITVIGGLAAFVTIVAAVSSFPIAALLFAPIILGGLLYYKGRGKHEQGPPRY